MSKQANIILLKKVLPMSAKKINPGIAPGFAFFRLFHLFTSVSVISFLAVLAIHLLN